MANTKEMAAEIGCWWAVKARSAVGGGGGGDKGGGRGSRCRWRFIARLADADDDRLT